MLLDLDEPRFLDAFTRAAAADSQLTAEDILTEWHRTAADLASPHLNRAAAALHTGDRATAAGELELGASHRYGEDGERLCHMAISLAGDAWEHEPRGPHGEWIGGGTAKDLLKAASPADLTRMDGLVTADKTPGQERDSALADIIARQGFDAPPVKGDMDAEVKAGGTAVFRGLHGDQAAQFKAAYLNGSDNRQGTGWFGNGNYFATSEKTAAGYSSGWDGGTMISAVLRHDAKVAPGFALWDELEGYRKDNGIGPGSPGDETLNNLSRYAALRGYDAVKIGKGDNESMIVFNRGALVVGE